MTVPSRKSNKPTTCSRCSSSSRRLPTWILCATGSHLFLSAVLVSVLRYSYHVPFSIPLLTTLQKQQQQQHRGKQQQRWKSKEQELRQKLNAASVQSCKPNTHTRNSCNRLLEESPDTAKAVLVLYNPLHQERILCDGTRIGPQSILLRNQELNCTEPPRLCSTEPTLENSGLLEPIQLHFYGNHTPTLEEFPCDVPCWRDHPRSKKVTLRRMVLNTPFRIVHSMEGPAYYERLRIQKRAHLHNVFYSTTSFESEIPLPYFSWEEYGNRMLQAEPVEFDKAIKGAVFLASNCDSRNKRELIVESLINMTQEMNDDIPFWVDSVSDCLHNAEKPEGTKDDKIQILRHYLFYLAFENQCETDYITEKLWSTFVAGIIPIYFGAPNIKDHVPPDSIINVHDFEITEDLMEYLIHVANNKTLYESYHAWRKQPFPLKLVEKYNFTHTHSICRTCRWAFAKKYGLGWDHSTQTVQPLKIPRKICMNEMGLLTYPVRESWPTAISLDDSEAILSANSTSGDRRRKLSNCDSKRGNQPKSLIIPFYDSNGKEHHNLQRTVINQDGATDMFLGPVNGIDSNENIIGESIRLRLATDIQGDKQLLKVMSDQFIRLQDSNNRMTILSSRSIQLVNIAKMVDGVVELELLDRAPEEGAGGAFWPIHIRIITEDVDTFYEDGQAFTSFYGRAMAEDFFNPLQSYVVQGSLIGAEDRNIWNNIRLESARLVEGAASEKEFIYPDTS